MILYTIPGSCSLVTHIALELGIESLDASIHHSHEVVVVSRTDNYSPEYLAISETGSAPALINDKGQLLLETTAILFHLARQFPAAKLAHASDDEGDQLMSYMSYMTTTVQPAFKSLWRSERFADGESARLAVEKKAEQRLQACFERLNRDMTGRYAVGDHFTMADAYLFAVARWGLRLRASTTGFPALYRSMLETSEMPAVRRAMATEGITLEGPESGLG